jgi:G:T/U-mismatch repair DNA glycosylase
MRSGISDLEAATMTRRETHPYNDQPIPDGTRLLIVGTAPPPRFSKPAKLVGSDFDFFYGSQDNYMWEFLDQIAEHIDGKNLFEENTSQCECCKIAHNFLKRHNIWMHDVLQTYQRKEGREDNAGDGDIKPPPDAEFTKFETVFKVRSISKLAFTSELAAEWTIDALKKQNLMTNPKLYNSLLGWRNHKNTVPIREYIKEKYRKPLERGNIEGRDVDFYMLPSPSGNARSRVYGLTLCRIQDIYEFVLFRNQPAQIL